jgi:hypothetical protein
MNIWSVFIAVMVTCATAQYWICALKPKSHPEYIRPVWAMVVTIVAMTGITALIFSILKT